MRYKDRWGNNSHCPQLQLNLNSKWVLSSCKHRWSCSDSSLPWACGTIFPVYSMCMYKCWTTLTPQRRSNSLSLHGPLFKCSWHNVFFLWTLIWTCIIMAVKLYFSSWRYRAITCSASPKVSFPDTNKDFGCLISRALFLSIFPGPRYNQLFVASLSYCASAVKLSISPQQTYHLSWQWWQVVETIDSWFQSDVNKSWCLISCWRP